MIVSRRPNQPKKKPEGLTFEQLRTLDILALAALPLSATLQRAYQQAWDDLQALEEIEAEESIAASVSA